MWWWVLLTLVGVVLLLVGLMCFVSWVVGKMEDGDG